MNQGVGYQGIRGSGKRIDTDFVWPRKGTKKRPKMNFFWPFRVSAEGGFY